MRLQRIRRRSSQFNIPSQTITKHRAGRRRQRWTAEWRQRFTLRAARCLRGTTSTYDAVNISNMTRLTANSVAIGDGYHTTMALATNNKLYIGANTCNNTTTGCLSVVDVSTNTADPPLAAAGSDHQPDVGCERNVMYAIEGGAMNIYDTTTDTCRDTQILFTGALYGMVQVDTQ